MYRQAYLARRLFIMLVGVFLVFLLIWVQVVHLLAAGVPETVQKEGRKGALAPMGNIVDRNGRLLAVDAPFYEVDMAAAGLSAGDVEAIVGRLADHGFSVAERLDVRRQLQAGQGVVTLAVGARERAENLLRDLRAAVSRQARGAIWTDVRWVRRYPNGPLALHVLGYRNWANEVEGGVHQYYASFLAHCNGLDPDHKHVAEVPGGISPFFPSPFRCDLALTIDVALQYAVERELDRAMSTYRPKSATVVVMDPRDGSILALASRPVFDPSHPYVSPAEAVEGLRNRAVAMMYEPGSVMKAVTFAAAYDAGVIGENTYIQDRAELTYSEGKIRNSQGRGYGRVTPATILAKSLNVATAEVAIRTGPDLFYRYLRAFGFGRVTEVDMGGEYPGLVRWPGQRDWSRFDLATNAFGQGISVTPIQLIRAVAVLANGGWLVHPHVVRGYYRRDTYYEVEWPPVRRVVKEETARVLTGWLTGVIDELQRLGQAPIPGVRAAGKTGTAEIAEKAGYKTMDRNVTFVGYFPARAPRAIVLVMLERPQTGPNRETVPMLWAYNTAYPVFVRVAQAILPYLEP